jgi:site-specific DNA-methyltransferase (adenine-specific)
MTAQTTVTSKTRSEHNRTITLTDIEKEQYMSKCLTEPFITETLSSSLSFLDKIYNANAMDILGMFPNSFVDLLVVDPPYNLSKKYGKSNFSKMSDDEYYRFTQQWIRAVKHILKSNASIYVAAIGVVV